MCWNKHKITAFSLSELLIAILIAIIVMGFAFFTLRFVHQKFDLFTDRILTNTSFARIEKNIWQDIHHFPSVELDHENQLIRFSSPLERVDYHYSNTHIERGGQLILTSPNSLLFYYKGVLVNAGPIDAFELIIYTQEKSLSLFFFLPKSAQLYS